MGRRRLAGFAPALAVGVFAFALAPAAAQAELHWYKGSTEIAKGAAHTQVATKGTLAFTYLNGTQVGRVVKCKVKDAEEIWNPFPVGNGEDQVNALEFTGCKATPAICPKKLFVEALGLPWHSKLWVKAPKEGDEIEGVKLEVGCRGGATGLFEGELLGPVSPGVAEFDEVLVDGPVEGEAELIDHLKGVGPGKIKVGP